MKKLPVIAIDGPAASGKGTLARRIAKELDFAFLDTGALYRAVAHIVLERGGDPGDEGLAVEVAEWLRDHLKPDMMENPALRDDRTGQAASQVAAFGAVRQALLDLQRGFAGDPGPGYKGAVLDGRDIGTVVCPHADVKLFVTARAEIRAERRLKELQSRGIPSTYEAVLKDMHARDARDASRQAAPMKPAEDAIVLDTSDLSAEEAFEKAMDIVKSRL